MNSDTYYTIASPAEGQYSVLRSKFIAYLYPTSSEEEAMGYVQQIRQKHYDARHVCWAYRLGVNGDQTRSNDDGEPSGTAGKPILGQLLSADVTNLIAIVVRYFGGVKLGTSGLIEAYRQATVEALASSERCICIIERMMRIEYGYELMGEVMRYVKDSGAKVLMQDFREQCALEISLRADDAPSLYARLDQLWGADVKWLEGDLS